MSTFKRVHVGVAVLLFAVAATGCGGGQSAAPPPGTAFKDMKKKERIAFMKQVVVPTMKPLFQQFDAKEFAEFNCMTCHGNGAKDGSFTMPNPDLPRLPATPEAFAAFAQDPKHEAALKFMSGTVKPTMAKLLMEQEFDPQTNTGEFACFSCHYKEGE